MNAVLKYAASLLKAGYIRHTVNKTSFSEQCYYVFGDIVPGGYDSQHQVQTHPLLEKCSYLISASVITS